MMEVAQVMLIPALVLVWVLCVILVDIDDVFR